MTLDDIKTILLKTMYNEGAYEQLKLLEAVLKADVKGERYYDAAAVNEADLILRNLDKKQRGMLLTIVKQVIQEVENG